MPLKTLPKDAKGCYGRVCEVEIQHLKSVDIDISLHNKKSFVFNLKLCTGRSKIWMSLGMTSVVPTRGVLTICVRTTEHL